MVKYFVEQGADVHVDKDYALRWAATNGHLDIIKRASAMFDEIIVAVARNLIHSKFTRTDHSD